MPPYIALVSSDWNECLAPCGPFDALNFHHPELSAESSRIFRQYTANTISLSEAVRQLQTLAPEGISRPQMDAYLESAFETYPGVVALIRWCLERRILFMINTTGMIGYFQRAAAARLLPRVPVLAAHPMIRYPASSEDPEWILELHEVADKAAHTAAVAARWQIPDHRIILMGDSGGDGPHFQWGAARGAHLIGCMAKSSLISYCRAHGIEIDHFFGPSDPHWPARDPQQERACDFRSLQAVIETVLLRAGVTL